MGWFDENSPNGAGSSYLPPNNGEVGMGAKLDVTPESGPAPGSLTAPWTQQFQPRDPSQIASDPSYQFQMEQGNRGIQSSAAARGTLLTGGTLKALSRFNQGLASTFDDKYYNRDMDQYRMSYDIFRNNQNDPYNKYMGLASLGQNAAAGVGNQASSYSQSAGDTMLQRGNATAAGTVGGANAIIGGIGGLYGYGGGPQGRYPWDERPY